MCGPSPGDEKKDRRKILRKWINDNWVEKNANSFRQRTHAFPIIIDELLKESVIKEKGLTINLVEEILSRCAYRTYIFLDTMSTGYEFGEFTNFAFGQNSVRVFLDKEYTSRVNCPIGAYLEMAMKCKTDYEAHYNGRGHIFFKNDVLPNEIELAIKDDNPVAPGYIGTADLSFIPTGERSSGAFGEVYFCIESDGTFVFRAECKTWFYFMALVQNKNSFHLEDIKSPKDTLYTNFISQLKKEILVSFCCLERSIEKTKVLFGPKKVQLECSTFGGDQDLVFYNIAAILGMIKSSDAPENGVSYPALATGMSEVVARDEFTLLLPKTRRLLDKYDANPSFLKYGMRAKTLTIKGKKRNIVCYANDKYGRDLCNYHLSALNCFLADLPTSDSSFAYKANRNTKLCLKKHEGNNLFVKYDIRHYFESIKKNSVVEKISKLVKHMDRLHIGETNHCLKELGFNHRDFKETVSKLIDPLFFHEKLPIGYSSSPKLSDFYLNNVDREMEKRPGVIYTRYADDILLSSKDKKSLESAEARLLALLAGEALGVNTKKIIRKELKNNGDSIRFLGINMVKRGDQDMSYTISNQYLVETSKLLERTMSQPPRKRLKVEGRVQYIKGISLESYEKLIRLVKLKMGFIPSFLEDKKGTPEPISYTLDDDWIED